MQQNPNLKSYLSTQKGILGTECSGKLLSQAPQRSKPTNPSVPWRHEAHSSMAIPGNTTGCPWCKHKAWTSFHILALRWKIQRTVGNELRLCQHRGHWSSGQGGLLNYREPSAAICIQFKYDLIQIQRTKVWNTTVVWFVPSISKLKARVLRTVSLAGSVTLSSWPSEDPSSIGLERLSAPREPGGESIPHGYQLQCPLEKP